MIEFFEKFAKVDAKIAMMIIVAFFLLVFAVKMNIGVYN
jgi:hypothetical protein